MNRVDTMVRVIKATASPYPASFGGSTILFQLALFALMVISYMGLTTAFWMGREIVRGRHESYPFEPLFAVRMIFFLAATGATMRALPEVVYMLGYGESNPDYLSYTLAAKRICDTLAIIPALGWMITLRVFYPRIGGDMELLNTTIPLMPKVDRVQVKRMVRSLIAVFILCGLIAIGKRG